MCTDPHYNCPTQLLLELTVSYSSCLTVWNTHSQVRVQLHRSFFPQRAKYRSLLYSRAQNESKFHMVKEKSTRGLSYQYRERAQQKVYCDLAGSE